jgi:hypothetical protein
MLNTPFRFNCAALAYEAAYSLRSATTGSAFVARRAGM